MRWRVPGIEYRGLLFPGLMMMADGARVLEFNCRFGDPETQAILPRLKSDLLDLLEATIDGKLADTAPEWDERASVTVVMASGGYPGKYRNRENDQSASMPAATCRTCRSFTPARSARTAES